MPWTRAISIPSRTIGRLATSAAPNRKASSGSAIAGSQPERGSWLPVTTNEGICRRASRWRPSRKAICARRVWFAPSKTSPATRTASTSESRARPTIRSQLRRVASRKALTTRSGAAWPMPRNGLSRCRSPVWTNRSPTPSANLENPEPDPPRRDDHLDGIARLAPDQRRADRRDIRDLVGLGAGLGGADDLERRRLEGTGRVHALDDDGRADRDDCPAGALDHDGVAELIFEHPDSPFGEGLLAARLVVVGVLLEVAQLPGGRDPGDDRRALDVDQLVELGAQGDQSLGRKLDRGTGRPAGGLDRGGRGPAARWRLRRRAPGPGAGRAQDAGPPGRVRAAALAGRAPGRCGGRRDAFGLADRPVGFFREQRALDPVLLALAAGRLEVGPGQDHGRVAQRRLGRGRDSLGKCGQQRILVFLGSRGRRPPDPQLG